MSLALATISRKSERGMFRFRLIQRPKTTSFDRHDFEPDPRCTRQKRPRITTSLLFDLLAAANTRSTSSRVWILFLSLYLISLAH